MAIGSGVGSQFGFSDESTYGTFVAPTIFLRATQAAVTPTYERPEGEGIQTGVLGNLQAHHVQTTQAATANVSFDAVTRGMGKILQWITGGTSGSSVNSSTSYTQTHTLAALTKAGSWQVGVPNRAGTVTPMTLKGGMVTSAEFSCGQNEILSCSVEVDGQAFTTSESLASASYLADKPFHFGQGTLKLGTKDSEAAVAGIRSVSLSFSRSLDVEDYTFGASGLKNQPVDAGNVEISGSIEIDWTAATKAAFHDRFVANTATSLVWEFVGDEIESSYDETLSFQIPGVRFDGEAESVDGKDAITNSYDFMWRYDGTNLPIITYITADTSI